MTPEGNIFYTPIKNRGKNCQMTFIIFLRPAGTSKNCINSSVTGLWYIVFKFAGASPRIAADHSGPVRVKFKAKGFEKISVFMCICMQANLRGCSCWVSGKPWFMMWTNSGVYVQMNASEAPRLQLLRGKLWRISDVEHKSIYVQMNATSKAPRLQLLRGKPWCMISQSQSWVKRDIISFFVTIYQWLFVLWVITRALVCAVLAAADISAQEVVCLARAPLGWTASDAAATDKLQQCSWSWILGHPGDMELAIVIEGPPVAIWIRRWI